MQSISLGVFNDPVAQILANHVEFVASLVQLLVEGLGLTCCGVEFLLPLEEHLSFIATAHAHARIVFATIHVHSTCECSSRDKSGRTKNGMKAA